MSEDAVPYGDQRDAAKGITFAPDEMALVTRAFQALDREIVAALEVVRVLDRLKKATGR